MTSKIYSKLRIIKGQAGEVCGEFGQDNYENYVLFLQSDGKFKLEYFYHFFEFHPNEKYDDEKTIDSIYEGTYRVSLDNKEETFINLHLTNFSEKSQGLTFSEKNNERCDLKFFFLEDKMNKNHKFSPNSFFLKAICLNETQKFCFKFVEKINRRSEMENYILYRNYQFDFEKYINHEFESLKPIEVYEFLRGKFNNNYCEKNKLLCNFVLENGNLIQAFSKTDNDFQHFRDYLAKNELDENVEKSFEIFFEIYNKISSKHFEDIERFYDRKNIFSTQNQLLKDYYGYSDEEENFLLLSSCNGDMITILCKLSNNNPLIVHKKTIEEAINYGYYDINENVQLAILVGCSTEHNYYHEALKKKIDEKDFLLLEKFKCSGLKETYQEYKKNNCVYQTAMRTRFKNLYSLTEKYSTNELVYALSEINKKENKIDSEESFNIFIQLLLENLKIKKNLHLSYNTLIKCLAFIENPDIDKISKFLENINLLEEKNIIMKKKYKLNDEFQNYRKLFYNLYNYNEFYFKNCLKELNAPFHLIYEDEIKILREYNFNEEEFELNIKEKEDPYYHILKKYHPKIFESYSGIFSYEECLKLAVKVKGDFIQFLQGLKGIDT